MASYPQSTTDQAKTLKKYINDNNGKMSLSEAEMQQHWNKFCQTKCPPKSDLEAFFRVAAKLNDKDLGTLITTGEIPAVALSQKEMEVLKGGIAPVFIFLAGAVVSGAAWSFCCGFYSGLTGQ